MTLEDAIDCINEESQNLTGMDIQYRFNALRLGLEALKRLEELRRYPDHNPKWLLPGETEE